MRKFATADCETDPFKHGRIPKPFVWGFYEENNFQYFYETKDFIEFISNYDGLIYFHNGGKFDIHFLLEDIPAQDNIMIINGRIAKIKLGEAEIRDSYLLLPVPLSAYKKDEIDYAIMEESERNKSKNKAEIIKYLEGDCKYLYEILEKQFEDYGQKLTLASSAFDYWHKNFSIFKDKPKSKESFFTQFKPYYYGGRVECFKKGIIKENFEVFDINSAYPHAMLQEHPYGDEYAILDDLPDEGLERCFIHFTGNSKGALPFRDKKGLSFPTDNENREYMATGWELKTGLENKKIKIKKIHRVYQFLNSISFGNYVKHFFDLKSKLKNVDEAKYLLSKLYLNSLYGKFGQSSLDHREYCLIESEYIEGYLNAEYDYESEIGDNALMSKPVDEHKMRFYNVATAASITGCVRAYLFQQILNCETPIYCDTDSIAGIGFKNIKIGKELGEWEKEGDFKLAAIGGKKLYAFERCQAKNNKKWKISSKGAKLEANEIISIAMGEKVVYKNIAPTFKIGKTTDFVVREIKLT